MEDRQKILKVLGPAAAVGVAVLLVGVLIALNQAPPDTGKRRSEPSADAAPPPAPADETGMADKLPPLDDAGWKPGPGGMRVWDVVEGTGEPARRGAEVQIHYTGWLKDGTVFDSSRAGLSPRGGDGRPAEFGLNGLIKGWQEGIPGMKPGGVRRLEIPYAWAYGDRGSPPTIPPKTDLVFEVKLFAAR